MNLVADPWIPVVQQDGAARLVSLMDAFTEGESIRDLSANPVQRISIMRLLICIAQAALDGPEDEEDWLACRDRIPEAARQYLEKWKERFDLYGEHAFLQVPGLEVKAGKDKPVSALDCRSPHGGSSSVLFDRSAIDPESVLLDSANALNLLCFMNFSTSGKVGQSMWRGVQYSESTFAAPCIKYAHTLVSGEVLLATLHLNLLSKSTVARMPATQWGHPVWERFPHSVSSSAEFANASETYLGRLVPLSRYVSFREGKDQGRCIAGPPDKAYRIEHLPSFREPTATVKLNPKKDECCYLRLDPAKHAWRELGSVVALVDATDGPGGALSLDNARLLAEVRDEQTVDIWVGGLALGGKEAKLGDMLEWRFSLDLGCFGDLALARYELGVSLAAKAASLLSSGTATYASALKQENSFAQRARALFWSALDAQYGALLNAAAELADLNVVWHPLVRDAMEEAYRRTCPHQTPRQIQAYAQGLRKLHLKKLVDGGDDSD